MKTKYSGKRGRVDCDDNQRDRGDQEEGEGSSTTQCEIFIISPINIPINDIKKKKKDSSTAQCKIFIIAIHFTNQNTNQ